MRHEPRPSALTRSLPGAVAAALLIGYLIVWARISPLDIGRSDFTATYVGALLLRRGLGSSMYLPSLQTPLYLQVIAPLHTGTLAFPYAPLAAAVAWPFTFLPFHTAYRVWSALQLLLIALAVVIAVRAAPRAPVGRRRELTIALIALSGAGSAVTLILGQWDGVWALGVALMYSWLRQRRMIAAGAVIAVTTLMAKPQLGLGFAAFLIGWRDRRLLLGAATGSVVSVLLWLLVAGPGGLAGFAGAIIHSIGVWQPSTMVSFLGVTGTLAGNTPAAHLLGAAGTVIFMGLAAVLGSSLRGHPNRLEAGLAAAALLSLLAAPHAYPQDVALLTPAVAWSLCTISATHPRPARLWSAGAGLWIMISVAVYLYIATGAAPPLGVLTPWILLVAAALATATCLRQGRTAPSVPAASDRSAATPTGNAAAPA